MYILGLATMGDSAAALLRDGEIVACAEEERFSRVEHHRGFPYRSLAYCLGEAGITLSEIDHVTHYWKPWILRRRVMRTVGGLVKGFAQLEAQAVLGARQLQADYLPMVYLPWKLRHEFEPARFHFHHIEHHLSHAASAFYCSPFDESAILSVDGCGEETTVLFAHGQGTRLHVLRRIKLPNTLGQFYAAVTNYLGFQMSAGEQCKVMEMAGWGEPTTADYLTHNVLIRDRPGSFKLDVSFLDHCLASQHRYSHRAERLWGPPRRHNEELTQRHFNIAASVQKAYEETLLSLLEWLYQETGCRDLCMAGGCALNSVANGKISWRTPFERLYVQPAANDGGAALGSALYLHHHVLGLPRRESMRHAAWGPQFDEPRCGEAADAVGLRPRRLSDEELPGCVADKLARGKFVAWFQGRMEWGPRALGNRSFLADPRRIEVKDLINRKIKSRERFRPFAPSLLAEASARYFGRPHDAPFMSTAFPVVPERRAEIPAVVHVDGTTRPQLVERDVNPRYWSLIKAFEERTGVPVLLNTSFNIGEPIVCTPEDAVRSFLHSEVEYLVMGNLLIPRPGKETPA